MRYLILVLLNLPVILLALINIVTRYKMGKVSGQRFRRQVLMWLVILLIVVGSFPFYNYLNDKPLLDSSELSLFDIVQTTAIIFLFYAVNHLRQQVDQTETTLRDLHQELSIKLSDDGPR